MNLLVVPSEPKPRRKSTSDLYKGMNVSKALSILKISEREYRELTDLEFREAFTRQQTENEAPAIPRGVVDNKASKKNKSEPKNPDKKIVDHKKLIEKNMRIHEAFQFLVKKRSTSTARKLARQETASTLYSLGRTDSVQSWDSQDLGGVQVQEDPAWVSQGQDWSDSESPAPKRRGSISPFLVGPGTPPPIDIPGLSLNCSYSENNVSQVVNIIPQDHPTNNPEPAQNLGEKKKR